MRKLPIIVASVALVVGLTVWLVPTPSEAGIVVLKNGNTHVGRIRPDEVTEESIIVRWPYLNIQERGHQVIPMYEVRWFSQSADEPTDEYWASHLEELIDPRWHILREKYRERIEGKPEDPLFEGLEIQPIDDQQRAKLSPLRVEVPHFNLRKPERWTARPQDGIHVIMPDDESGWTAGCVPRIHVFSVESLQTATADEQVRFIDQELAKVIGQGATFQIKEAGELTTTRNDGFDRELLTLTTLDDKPIYALRHISFRKGRTYFFSAYAHANDYDNLKWLYRACLQSMVILEDQVSSDGSKTRR